MGHCIQTQIHQRGRKDKMINSNSFRRQDSRRRHEETKESTDIVEKRDRLKEQERGWKREGPGMEDRSLRIRVCTWVKKVNPFLKNPSRRGSPGRSSLFFALWFQMKMNRRETVSKTRRFRMPISAAEEVKRVSVREKEENEPLLRKGRSIHRLWSTSPRIRVPGKSDANWDREWS